MKRTIAVIAFLTAVALVGCSQPKDSGRTIRSGRGTGAGGAGAGAGGIPGAAGTSSGPQIASPQSVGQLGWGIVTPADNNAAKNFLSTDFSQVQVGNTTNIGQPCMIGQLLGGGPCIIKMTVTKLSQPSFNPVTLLSGSLMTTMNLTTPNYTSDGYITLVIWDSISGTNPTNDSNYPQGYPPIPVVIPLSSSSGANNAYVSQYGASFVGKAQGFNTQVNLIFADDEGAVGVFGNVTGNQLSGQVQFSNTKNVNGGNPSSGTLGNFTINVCDILAPCP